MKLSKEAVVWIKQQEKRAENCKDHVRQFRMQIKIHSGLAELERKIVRRLHEAIVLEFKQIRIIAKEVVDYRNGWKKTKGGRK